MTARSNRDVEVPVGGVSQQLQDVGLQFRRTQQRALVIDPGVSVGCLADRIRQDLHRRLHLRVVVWTTDEALDLGVRGGGIHDRLAASGSTHQQSTVGAKCHDRGGGPVPLAIPDDLGFLAVERGDARVRGTQIDA